MRISRFGGWMLALLLQALSVFGADDYLLEIDGIPGESTAETHPNTIQIDSFSFGVSNPAILSGGGTTSGKASFSDFSFNKSVDRSTPLLYLFSAQGKLIKKVVLYGRKAGETAKPEDFYVLTLEDVLVTSVQTSGSSGGVPMESVSLNFAKIHLSYKPQLSDGRFGDPVRFGWDISKNVPYSP